MVVDSTPIENGARTIEYTRRTDAPMSLELVTAITAIDGREPTELDPIARSIDPDALDALTEAESEGLRITFSTNGYQVQIKGSSRILVRKSSQEE